MSDGIDKYFETNTENVLLGIPHGSGLQACLNDLLDTNSPDLPWIASLSNAANRRVINCLDRGYNEAVLMHEACGGGYIGINAFTYLSLKNDIKASIKSFVNKLPSEFNAIHCRYTDYQSDLDMLLQQLNDLSMDGIPIYFATDNRELLRRVQSLKSTVQTLNFCSTFSGDNQPIHNSKHSSQRVVVEELLAELSILALAKKYMYPLLTNPTDPCIPKSGFSILAENLRHITKDKLLGFFTETTSVDEEKMVSNDNDALVSGLSYSALHVPDDFSLCISMPTFRRINEFTRLMQQISREITRLPESVQSCVIIRILENPSEFTDRKRAIAKAFNFGSALMRFDSHLSNIGGDANIAIAYSLDRNTGYNWVIGDDEQIVEGALIAIVQYLVANRRCGLLILHDPSNPPSSALLEQQKWKDYKEFARYASHVEPFQLISHSLISLNIVRCGIFDFNIAKFEADVVAKRVGLLGSYAHLIAIITCLCKKDGQEVHFLSTGTVNCSNRSPHEEVTFSWSDVRWLWRHYMYWLCYYLGLDYEAISAHKSMDIVYNRV